MQNTGPVLEMWGGVESTVNRVGDWFHDQWAWSQHDKYFARDLETFASLGLRTLRTAVLWERVQQHGWRTTDEILNATCRAGIEPILGLLHHGSGPASTDLLDARFPEKFADYALRVARRYPWATWYTPINEPQTTGRFSCLYGHWFPHHRSMRSYVRALFHQMKGIVLAMEAIRTVQPQAHLVHTEDGGETFAAPSLEAFRVEREHRRWLGLDLLCGRVTRDHPLFDFLLRNGMDAEQIAWFSEHRCAPDVIGLNYYVTSDRYLDERVELYAPFMRGGDTGDEPLVDVEAVRAHHGGIAGIKQVLLQAWERYKLPLAVTEAHLGCETVQQMRWLAEIWTHASEARAAGADVRAVTAWGLLGLHDWCNLCTEKQGVYEGGVIDISGGARKPTQLGELVAQLARGEEPADPRLRLPGWWRLDSRINLPPACTPPWTDAAATASTAAALMEV